MKFNRIITNRRSIRLKEYDYSQEGYYYITVCTKNRECWFGDVVSSKIKLSDLGKIVYDEWLKTEQIRDNVETDIFVVMPNHIHGIVIINDNVDSHVGAPRWGAQNIDMRARHRHAPTNKYWKPNSLGSIINQFKSVVTKRIHSIGHHNFAWQRNYYEHIIRNENELNKIQEYIINNPLQWGLDENNPNSLLTNV